jgi:hypothetical protein
MVIGVTEEIIMGEASRKQRRRPNEERSEIVITLRGSPAGRAHFAEKIVKLIGPSITVALSEDF